MTLPPLTDQKVPRVDPIEALRVLVAELTEEGRRVLEKAGFAKEAILRSSVIKNGVILDEHLYALVKD